MNGKGCGRKRSWLILRYCSGLFLEWPKKTINIRKLRVPAEIWTGYPDRQVRSHSTNLQSESPSGNGHFSELWTPKFICVRSEEEQNSIQLLLLTSMTVIKINTPPSQIQEQFYVASYNYFWQLFCLLHTQCWFVAWLILRPWRWRRHVLPKRRLIFSGLHGVISQKIKLVYKGYFVCVKLLPDFTASHPRG
jgi:hypothetical protein